MNAPEPLQGISKMYEYDNIKCFRVDCSCMSPEHNLIFDVEYDTELQDITSTTYVDVTTDYWSEKFKPTITTTNTFLYTIIYSLLSIVNSLALKLKITYNIWINGKITLSTGILMTKEQALNYSKILENTVHQLEKNNKHE
jgi:hypothetical protein